MSHIVSLALSSQSRGIRHRSRILVQVAPFALLLIVLMVGCARQKAVISRPSPEMVVRELPRMGYAIQVGAFSCVDNAAMLTDSLKRQGIDAYYFQHKKGLYKVRFGNFPSLETAREQAQSLKSQGMIDEFYIVSPDEYPLAKARRYGTSYLRDEITSTAKGFIGVPYLWGGSSLREGFDCSGLTMAVYQLNGLNLPRSSQQQFAAGTPVEKSLLQRGDLVFFTTSDTPKTSHVGLYIGQGRFVHAPGEGKKISIDSLSNPYFSARYAGGRSYLPSEVQ